jgi:hypothetical protein
VKYPAQLEATGSEAAVAVESDPRQFLGLDHGTWSVLRHVYPSADIPVVQLSIDETKPAAFHFEIGKKLAPLRDEGVLIAGSGNLVHNLHTYAWGGHPRDPDWALRFENAAKEMMIAGDLSRLSTRRALVRMRRFRFRPPITTCRCSQFSALDSRVNALNSRSIGSMAGQSPCWRCRWDERHSAEHVNR